MFNKFYIANNFTKLTRLVYLLGLILHEHNVKCSSHITFSDLNKLVTFSVFSVHTIMSLLGDDAFNTDMTKSGSFDKGRAALTSFSFQLLLSCLWTTNSFEGNWHFTGGNKSLSFRHEGKWRRGGLAAMITCGIMSSAFRQVKYLTEDQAH